MSIDYIVIVLGEPYSTFSEIIGKYFSKKKKFKQKIILVGNKNLLKEQLNYLNFKISFNCILRVEDAKKKYDEYFKC